MSFVSSGVTDEQQSTGHDTTTDCSPTDYCHGPSVRTSHQCVSLCSFLAMGLQIILCSHSVRITLRKHKCCKNMFHQCERTHPAVLSLDRKARRWISWEDGLSTCRWSWSLSANVSDSKSDRNVWPTSKRKVKRHLDIWKAKKGVIFPRRIESVYCENHFDEDLSTKQEAVMKPNCPVFHLKKITLFCFQQILSPMFFSSSPQSRSQDAKAKLTFSGETIVISAAWHWERDTICFCFSLRSGLSFHIYFWVEDFLPIPPPLESLDLNI